MLLLVVDGGHGMVTKEDIRAAIKEAKEINAARRLAKINDRGRDPEKSNGGKLLLSLVKTLKTDRGQALHIIHLVKTLKTRKGVSYSYYWSRP